MNETLDSFQAVWLQIQHAPSHLLLILALNVLGLLAKKTPWVNNAYIPHLLIISGGALYPFLAEPALEVYQKAAHPAVVLVLNGALLGAAAWLAHRIIIKRGAAWVLSLLPVPVQKALAGLTDETQPPFPKDSVNPNDPTKPQP